MCEAGLMGSPVVEQFDVFEQVEPCLVTGVRAAM